jgi:hypothetical protein
LLHDIHGSYGIHVFLLHDIHDIHGFLVVSQIPPNINTAPAKW